LLTLFITPVVYLYFEHASERWKAYRARSRPAEPAASRA
jgi:hypothetical protein